MNMSMWEIQRTKANEDRVNDLSQLYLLLFQRSVSSPNMMPAAEGMPHMIPNHVLRVGQTIRLDPTHEKVSPHPSSDHGDPDLDISLDNLNRLIMELDPTFEPIQGNQSSPCTSPPTGTVWPYSHFVLKFLCVSTPFTVLFHIFLLRKTHRPSATEDNSLCTEVWDRAHQNHSHPNETNT